MIGAGTLIWSNLYWIVLLVVAVLVAWGLTKMWLAYGTKVEAAGKNTVLTPSPIGPIIATIVVVGLFAVGGVLAWNAMQDATTNVSTYENPAQNAEQKRLQQTKLPTKDEMDKARAELKERAEVKPHEKALTNFDQAMEAEAERIRQRNSAATQPVEKK